jgi:hypothetical protein
MELKANEHFRAAAGTTTVWCELHQISTEAPVRTLARSSALLAAAAFLTPLTSAAVARDADRPKTMTIRLDSGDTATFHLMKVGGKMMAMIPYDEFQTVFRRYMGGPHPWDLIRRQQWMARLH